MVNLILRGFTMLIEIIFILRLAKLRPEWLYGFIVVNLLLITTLGGKLVDFLGFTTNVGNIFYASIYLATYMLIEYNGASAAYRGMWIGASAVFLFILLAQLATSMTAAPEARELDNAIHTVFQESLRISMASIFAFVMAQSVNIWLYQTLRKKTKTAFFWMRVAVSSIVAQAVDSVLFFFIAFAEVIPLKSLATALLAGYALKVLFSLFAIPFLYSRLPKVGKA